MKMKRFNMNSRIVVLLSMGFLMTACATYYEVKDPTTGNIYYTEKVKRDQSATIFKDARSGAEVTIQNSEIREISGKEFDAGRAAPAAKPAAAPAPAPKPAASAPATESTPAPEPSDQTASPAE
jgi:hypothetical protein